MSRHFQKYNQLIDEDDDPLVSSIHSVLALSVLMHYGFGEGKKKKKTAEVVISQRSYAKVLGQNKMLKKQGRCHFCF